METLKLKLLLLMWFKRRRRRRYWVHPIFQLRETFGEYHHLMQQILSDEEKCQAYIRMKPDTFKPLLEIIGPHIEKRTTNFRRPLSARECLVITLRYLASEDTHQSQSFHFRAGLSTVKNITRETCVVIWNTLQPQVMPKPDEEHWLKIASEFFTRFQFPLCLGAVDGKHIQIKKPNWSGSKYFNYKHFFSIVLLAVTDANGKFVVVDVGSCGSNSDGGVFSRSSLGKKLLSNTLSIPQGRCIPGTDIELPYMFVADEAFPLRENIMKPFPHRQLSTEKEMFNYRLSRARNSVECSFGRLAQMWRILFRQIDEQPTAATNIVKAITVLHNFVIINEPHRLILDTSETPTLSEDSFPRRLTYQNIQTQRQRSTKSGMQVREKLVKYFMTEGALPWQSNTS